MLPAKLRHAAADLRWLYDRGYPQTASVTLVGDRWRLSRDERRMLYRGVSSSADAARRASLLVTPGAIAGIRLGIDAHNVLLTLANYLHGVAVFAGDDSVVRDIGALHGRVRDRAVMERSLELCAAQLEACAPGGLFVAFDAPVAHSREHAHILERRLGESSLEWHVTVVVEPSADAALRHADIDAVATSDAPLIDSLALPLIDLPRAILEGVFAARLDSFCADVDPHPTD